MVFPLILMWDMIHIYGDSNEALPERGHKFEGSRK
jgi:hypothetical protein